MKILKNNNKNFFDDLKILLESRSQFNFDNIDNHVHEIIEEVKLYGDSALCKYSEIFDGVKINSEDLLIDKNVRNSYKKNIDFNHLKSFERSIENVTHFHEKQIPKNYEINKNNLKIGSYWKPIESVGLYVPGGQASYPSSLIMNAVPARVAGVKRLVVVSPPKKEGLNPYILALLDILNVEEAYQVGGAHSIAALAYGTKSILPVNKIFGPGNAFVASAKKQVFGKVGIDLIAGPSEIVIVADKDNNSDWVASDLMAQAEHDINSQSILITDSLDFAKNVLKSVDKLIINLTKKDTIKKSLTRYGIIIILDDILKSPEIINFIAPEHLHLQNKSKDEIFKQVNNVGTTFLGEYTSEAFGDYIVGTNHILPTSGSSKYSSGLGVLDFMKRSSYVELNEISSSDLENDVSIMADIENLDAHKLSVKIRQEGKK